MDTLCSSNGSSMPIVSTLYKEKQMLPADTERAVDKLMEMVVSIKRIGH